MSVTCYSCILGWTFTIFWGWAERSFTGLGLSSVSRLSVTCQSHVSHLLFMYLRLDLYHFLGMGRAQVYRPWTQQCQAFVSHLSVRCQSHVSRLLSSEVLRLDLYFLWGIGRTQDQMLGTQLRQSLVSEMSVACQSLAFFLFHQVGPSSSSGDGQKTGSHVWSSTASVTCQSDVSYMSVTFLKMFCSQALVPTTVVATQFSGLDVWG
jgi:hypothetical protein